MSAPARNLPVALTIAGSDSSAGAGLQADLKTFSALGVYGLTTVTCVVAEVPGKVTRIDAVAPENVRAQLDLLLEKFPVAAIKTGLLYSREIVELVAEVLGRRAGKIPLVVDPVMIATSGDRLLEPAAVRSYEERLFPLATLVTPNLAEAAALTSKGVTTRAEMEKAGAELCARYRTRFLIKGGHLTGDQAVDLLCDGTEAREFSAPFLPGIATHGTGCTYSAAITAGLAKGQPLLEAIAPAKEFVSRALGEHFRWPSSLGDIDALNHSA
jgi:hydroxymethylpyrimidine/phosphomethylpyrimidine kinase